MIAFSKASDSDKAVVSLTHKLEFMRSNLVVSYINYFDGFKLEFFGEKPCLDKFVPTCINTNRIEKPT